MIPGRLAATATSSGALQGHLSAWIGILEGGRELSREVPNTSGEACSINAAARAAVECRRALSAKPCASLLLPARLPLQHCSFHSSAVSASGLPPDLHDAALDLGTGGPHGISYLADEPDELGLLAREWRRHSITTCHSQNSSSCSSTKHVSGTSDSRSDADVSSQRQLCERTCTLFDQRHSATSRGRQRSDLTTQTLPFDPGHTESLADIITAASECFSTTAPPPPDLARSLVAAATAAAETAPWPAAIRILQGLTQMGTVGTRYFELILDRVKSIPLATWPPGRDWAAGSTALTASAGGSDRGAGGLPRTGWASEPRPLPAAPAWTGTVSAHIPGGGPPSAWPQVQLPAVDPGPGPEDAVRLLTLLCSVHSLPGPVSRNTAPAVARLMEYLQPPLLEALPGPLPLLPLLRSATTCGWNHDNAPAFLKRIGDHLSAPCSSVASVPPRASSHALKLAGVPSTASAAQSAVAMGTVRCSNGGNNPVPAGAWIAANWGEELARGPRLLALTPAQLAGVADDFLRAGVHHSDLMERALDVVDRCLSAFTASQVVRVAAACERFRHVRPTLMRRMALYVGAHLPAAVAPGDVAGMVAAMARCQVREERFLDVVAEYAHGHTLALLQGLASRQADMGVDVEAEVRLGSSAAASELSRAATAAKEAYRLFNDTAAVSTADAPAVTTDAAETAKTAARMEVTEAEAPSGTAAVSCDEELGAPGGRAVMDSGGDTKSSGQHPGLLTNGSSGSICGSDGVESGLDFAPHEALLSGLKEELRATAAAAQQLSDGREGLPPSGPARADEAGSLRPSSESHELEALFGGGLLSPQGEPALERWSAAGSHGEGDPAAAAACSSAGEHAPVQSVAAACASAALAAGHGAAAPPGSPKREQGPSARPPPLPSETASAHLGKKPPPPKAGVPQPATMSTGIDAGPAGKAKGPHAACSPLERGSTSIRLAAIAAGTDPRTGLYLTGLPYDLEPHKLLDQLVAVPGVTVDMFYMPYNYAAVSTGRPGTGRAFVSVATPEAVAALYRRLRAGPLYGMRQKVSVEYVAGNTSSLLHTLFELRHWHKDYVNRSNANKAWPLLLYVTGSLRGQIQPLDPQDVVMFDWPRPPRASPSLPPPAPQMVAESPAAVAAELDTLQPQLGRQSQRQPQQLQHVLAAGLRETPTDGGAGAASADQPSCPALPVPDTAESVVSEWQICTQANLCQAAVGSVAELSPHHEGGQATKESFVAAAPTRLEDASSAACLGLATRSVQEPHCPDGGATSRPVRGSSQDLVTPAAAASEPNPAQLEPAQLVLVAHCMASLSHHHPTFVSSLARLMDFLVVQPVRRKHTLAAALLPAPAVAENGSRAAAAGKDVRHQECGVSGRLAEVWGTAALTGKSALLDLKSVLHVLHAVASLPDPNPATFRGLADVSTAALCAWLPPHSTDCGSATDAAAATPLVPLPPSKILDIHVKLLAQVLSAAADRGPSFHHPALCAAAAELLRLHLPRLRPRAAAALLQPLVRLDPESSGELVRAVVPSLVQHPDRLFPAALVNLTWACARTDQCRYSPSLVSELARRTVKLLPELPTSSAAQLFWALAALRPAGSGTEVASGKESLNSADGNVGSRSSSSPRRSSAGGTHVVSKRKPAGAALEGDLLNAFRKLMQLLLNRYDLTARDLLLVQEGLRLMNQSCSSSSSNTSSSKSSYPAPAVKKEPGTRATAREEMGLPAMETFLQELLDRVGVRQDVARGVHTRPVRTPRRHPGLHRATAGEPAVMPSREGSGGGKSLAAERERGGGGALEVQDGDGMREAVPTVEERVEQAAAANIVALEATASQGEGPGGGESEDISLGPAVQEGPVPLQGAGAPWPLAAIVPPPPLLRPQWAAEVSCAYSAGSCAVSEDTGVRVMRGLSGLVASGEQGQGRGQQQGEDATAAFLGRGLLQQVVIARQGLVLEEAGGLSVRLHLPDALQERVQLYAWG